jgi:hypothetical protein
VEGVVLCSKNRKKEVEKVPIIEESARMVAVERLSHARKLCSEQGHAEKRIASVRQSRMCCDSTVTAAVVVTTLSESSQ